MLPLLGLLPAAAELGAGIFQKIKANNLKKSNYIPPQLLMNRDLAMQQAYSRRAPGAAFSEEQNRRLAANQIGGAQRMFGGDANKIAAISAGAIQGAQDANTRIASQGQQFSENAFGKLSNANNAIAQQNRINQEQYLNTKNALDNAGNTNLFSGISNAATFGIINKAAKGDLASQYMTGTNPGAQTVEETPTQSFYPRINQGLRIPGIGSRGAYNQRSRRIKLSY